MKKLNKNQWIGVISGLALLAYLLYGDPIMQIFNQPKPAAEANNANQNLIVEELSIGQGAAVAAGDVVTVHYVGRLTDGKIFDSSRDRNVPFSFTLGGGQVIRGWDEGLVGMHIGGTRRLIISPAYGYGSQAVGPIPADSTLIFEVELLDANRPQ